MMFKFKLSLVESRGSKMFKLWIIPAVVVACLWAGDLFAQNPDSLIVINASGQPNDTVDVNISAVNVDSIAGFVIQVSFNTNILEVVDVLPTARSVVLPNFGYNFPSPGGIVRIVAFDMSFQNFIQPGSGSVVLIKFRILDNVPNGTTPIDFFSTEDGDNTWSTPDARLIEPELVGGFISISGGIPNDPPQIDIDPAAPQDVYFAYEGSTLQLLVSATDPDDDYIVLSAANLPFGASFSTVEDTGFVQGTFSYTPPAGSSPDTFMVTFTAEDGFFSPTRTITIYLLEGGANQPPVIIPVAPQFVNEGSHLEFDVTAYDPDGDPVTLEASSVPPNAHFSITQQGDSSVTGTFTFDPDFTQGPDTVNVRFVARDDRNNVRELFVQIIIFDAPNDFLEVSPGAGALPGAQSRELTINFSNNKPSYGLQFDLLFSPQVLDIRSAEPSERAIDLAFFDTLMENGRYRILVFSFGGDVILPGSGEIVRFVVDVDPGALPGPTVVDFDSATSVQDSLGASKNIIYDAGTFTVDILGDANLDGLVSVGDCVAIVAELLERIQFDIRAFDAADFNRDSFVTIADLMEVVNHILGRSIVPSPPLQLAGNVELIREGLYPGVRMDLPLWISLDDEGAGVQFAIDYDPSLVKVHGVYAGDMVSDLRFDFQDTGEKICGVIYDLDLSVFGPAVGELVSIDVEVTGDDFDPSRALRLTDFELVNVDAQVLNIQILGELPVAYSLYQNYPNPFNARTTLSFDMPYSSYVRVTVYNVLGQVVADLFDGYLEAGSHQLKWDGTDSSGNNVTSGVYFYRLQAENFDQTRKMLLVK